jgi:hypothetical protein
MDEQRSLMDTPNKVPEHQRFYQQAFRQHTRLWQIVCLSLLTYAHSYTPRSQQRSG